jgi:hypothetical protein
MYCELRVRGHLSPIWTEWLAGITITNLESQEAILVGYVVDQAALLGLLNRLYALNISLLAITCRNDPLPSPSVHDALS